MRFAPLPLALALAFAACQSPDGPGTPTEPTARGGPEPAPRLAAVVQRFEIGFVQIFDPDRNIYATVGLVSPLADLPDCGGSGTTVLKGRGTFQLVIPPTGAAKVFQRVRQGEVVLYGLAAENPCDLIGAPVIGRGPGNLTISLTGPATNVLSVRLIARLQLTTGGLAHLVIVGHAKINSDGSLKVLVDKSTLTPIGH